jgi:hypothetical protein
MPRADRFDAVLAAHDAASKWAGGESSRSRAERCGGRWGLAAALTCGMSAVLGQGASPLDRAPKQCLSVTSVARMEGLDEQNVLFRVRGNLLYRNHLPSECPGLDASSRFAYRTNGQLCESDTITVFSQWNSRLDPGVVCRLGPFQPIGAEEIGDFTSDDDGRRPSGRAVKIEPLEPLRPGDAPKTDSAPAPSESSTPPKGAQE